MSVSGTGLPLGVGLWLGSPDAEPEVQIHIQVLYRGSIPGEAEWGKQGRIGE